MRINWLCVAVALALPLAGCTCEKSPARSDNSKPAAPAKATAEATTATTAKPGRGKLARQIIGRWKGLLDLEFKQDGTYIIHGEGGDVDGTWKPMWESAKILTIETEIADVSTDKIELSFTDADHFTWKNLGTWKPGQELSKYERQK